MENNLFVCACADINHQFVISFDPDPDFNNMIFVQIHLTDVGFLERLKYAVQYILGKKSRYSDGAFGSVLLNKENTASLIKVLENHYMRMN